MLSAAQDESLSVDANAFTSLLGVDKQRRTFLCDAAALILIQIGQSRLIGRDTNSLLCKINAQ